MANSVLKVVVAPLYFTYSMLNYGYSPRGRSLVNPYFLVFLSPRSLSPRGRLSAVLVRAAGPWWREEGTQGAGMRPTTLTRHHHTTPPTRQHPPTPLAPWLLDSLAPWLNSLDSWIILGLFWNYSGFMRSRDSCGIGVMRDRGHAGSGHFWSFLGHFLTFQRPLWPPGKG